MKYRLAKPSDVNEMVNIHYSIRDYYSIGIFAQLGKQFLKSYYKLVLNDKNSVVVCAEDDNGNIQGFSSANLNVEEQLANLRRNNIKLGFATLSTIIRKPFLLKALLDRHRSTKINIGSNFISSTGARLEYWAWSATNKDSVSSFEMHEVHLNVLKCLGVKDIYFEVDVTNKKVFRFHELNGAIQLYTKKLPDGRIRAFMKYSLQERNPE